MKIRSHPVAEAIMRAAQRQAMLIDRRHNGGEWVYDEDLKRYVWVPA